MTRIVLHIDRLVLRGIDRTDAAAVTAALQEELQRRLALPGARAELSRGAAPRIDAGRVRLAAGTRPGALGRASGRRIARGILR